MKLLLITTGISEFASFIITRFILWFKNNGVKRTIELEDSDDYKYCELYNGKFIAKHKLDKNFDHEIKKHEWLRIVSIKKIMDQDNG